MRIFTATTPSSILCPHPLEGEQEVEVGIGQGPKRTLKLVNYWLESRPLTDPRPHSLGLNLDLTQKQA